MYGPLKPQNFHRGLHLGAEQFFKIFGDSLRLHVYFPNWGLMVPILIFWLMPCLLIGHWKSFILLFHVSITFSWTLHTMPCESCSVLTICAIDHLFLPMFSLSNTASATGKFLCLYSIFVVLGDSEGILFVNGTKIPQQYAALVSIIYVSTGQVHWILLVMA